jgi:type IV pilus assembly protein PilB
MDEFSLARLVAESYGLNFQEVDPENINIESQNKLNQSYIQTNTIFPFDVIGNTLKVAICDQSKLNVAKHIKVITDMEVELILVTISNLEKLYVKVGITPIAVLETSGSGTLTKLETEEQKELPILKERDYTEAEQFVHDLLLSAYKMDSSDIHIESFRVNKRVRFRVDGILINQKEFFKKINEKYLAVVSILKLRSGAKIEEKRLPQDGALQFKDGNIEFDVRVSFLPTHGAERVVLRILRKDAIQYDLDTLGFTKKDVIKLLEAISATQGLILVTGPTGSGKTTTLYSILNHLNDEKKNILTAEDPIEYELEGINQCQINAPIGYTFPSALRTFLRQDPEIILVGEIRDKETGNIAVEASLTGHLVLSTLHTNDAVNTITRLVDMGIPNYLVASTLSIVVAQRLPQSICANCKVEDKEISINKLNLIGITKKIKTFKGKGCAKCNQTGHKGRHGVYEILKVTPTIQDLILKNKTSPEISIAAKKEGYKTIQEQGRELIEQGTLTFEEYRRTLFLA